MKCPMCGYERGAADIAPAWQCPSCKVAYVKAAAAAASFRAEPVIEKSARPEKPILGPGTESKRERTQQDLENLEAGIREWQAMRGQKILIYSILLNFLIRGAERMHALPDLVLLALSL